MRLPKDTRIGLHGDVMTVSATMTDQDEVFAVLRAMKLILPFIPETAFVPPAAKDLSEAMDVIYNVVPLRAG